MSRFITAATAILFLILLTPSAWASNHYKIGVITSPDVHKVGWKVPLSKLEEAGYDITKFTVDVELIDPEKTFEELLKRFDVSESKLKKYPAEHKEALKNVLLKFQKIEAEGVFYRDLKTIMDKQHKFLMGKSQYQKLRQPNVDLVNEWFNMTNFMEDMFIKQNLYDPNKHPKINDRRKRALEKRPNDMDKKVQTLKKKFNIGESSK